MLEKQHFPDETLAYRLISEKVVKSENIKIQIWIFLSSPFLYTLAVFQKIRKYDYWWKIWRRGEEETENEQ